LGKSAKGAIAVLNMNWSFGSEEINGVNEIIPTPSIYRWEIETSLAQYGLEIPFPQRDLHLKTINNELLDKIFDGKRNESTP
jgi:small-conductance mechanosensitive channel